MKHRILSLTLPLLSFKMGSKASKITNKAGTKSLRHRKNASAPEHDPSVEFGPPVPAATAASAFFQRLPPELRRRVLIAAFGARTVHVEKGDPAAGRPSGKRLGVGCECMRRPDEDYGQNATADWCMCRAKWTHGDIEHRRRAGWGPGAPLGVMGWLLACRLS